MIPQDAPERGPETIGQAIAAARACTLCAAHLPLGPNPVFRIAATARIVLISQAPSTGAHRSGVPWTEASGTRLRGWMGLDAAQFFDWTRIAILPVGFCYPGRLPAGGDAPPRPECAPAWHARLRRQMPDLRLHLLIGGYAQRLVLGPGTMTSRVRDHARHLPHLPLPHPSWRTAVWEKNNPWFAADVLPVLRQAVAGALAG